MGNTLNNMRIRNKIALASTFIVIVSVVVVGFSFYTYAKRDVQRVYYENAYSTTAGTASHLNQRIEIVIEKLYSIKYSNKVNGLLKAFFEDRTGSYSITLTELSREFSSIANSDDFIDSIYIYAAGGEFYDYANQKNPDFDFIQSDFYRTMPEVLNLTIRSDESIFESADKTIAFSIKHKIEGYRDEIVIIVHLDVSQLTRYLGENKTDLSNEVMLLQTNGAFILGTDELLGQSITQQDSILQSTEEKMGINRIVLGKDAYILSYDTLNAVPWCIVNMQNEDELLTNINAMKNYVIILVGLSIAVCIVASVLLSTLITKPLTLLQKTISHVSEGDYDIECDYTYDNEIGALSRNFNLMLKEIKSLIERLQNTIAQLKKEKDKVKHEQNLKRKAEIKALQSQINPHFLYNTLGSISWLADAKDAPEIAEIASALGDFYRIGLSKGKDIITVGDELEHVRHYLQIQKIRFNESLTYSFDVDERIKPYAINKLVLQPLVENAIIHGENPLTRTCTIIVRAVLLEDDHLIQLTVSDEGGGIEDDRLEKINRRLADIHLEADRSHGYGIFNINERLQLTFGSNYGLTLQNADETGARAVITIPVTDMEEL